MAALPADLLARARSLPKVLLHEHLDGGLRVATLLDLLRQRGIASPAPDEDSLAAWFDAANRTRDLLRTTVRGDLAMVELLLAWAGGDRGRAVGARR